MYDKLSIGFEFKDDTRDQKFNKDNVMHIYLKNLLDGGKLF